MSSALDEDTRRAIGAGRQTAGEMLRAAQKDLQKVFVVFLVGFLGTFYSLAGFSTPWGDFEGVWEFLKDVTEAQMQAATAREVEIIAQTPFDVVLLQAKIGLVTGLLLAVPPFLYYARDPLKRRGVWPQSPVPRWKLVLIGLVALVLFTGGLLYGYQLFFPIMFSFLAENAINVGLDPRYSIVKWSQFILLLTLSFGFAAELPLVMTALAYAEIVPYETFRDKWRYAVVAIFVFGAMFSPPDPFTQIMWAVPLLLLYGFSLYLTKIVVTAKRGSQAVDVPGIVRDRWNVVGGVAVVGFALVYFGADSAAETGIGSAVGSFTASLGVTLPDVFSLFGLSRSGSILLVSLVVALLVAVVTVMYLVYVEIDAATGPVGRTGDPSGLDVGALDAGGVRAAPPEAFANMTEDEAVALAGEAIDDGDHEKAQAILDRFDETHEGDATGEASEPPSASAGPSRPRPAFGYDGLRATLARGSDRVDWRRRLRARWNGFLGVVALAAGLVYWLAATAAGGYVGSAVKAYLPGLTGNLGGLLVWLAADQPLETALGTAAGVGLVVGVLALAAWALRTAWDAATDPTAVDVELFTAEEIRGLPRATFATMTEDEALHRADAAVGLGDGDRAQAILDRYDEAEAAREREREPEAESEPEAGSVGDRTSRAGGAFLDELTEGEQDEDDIGGYYKDIAFIVESLTSKTFRIVGLFMLVMGASFFWLYQGGLLVIKENFVNRVPYVSPSDLQIITLHPVEALIFEVKFSALLGALVVLPLVAYYAWPAMRERDIVRGHRSAIFLWTAALLGGLAGGLYVGWGFIAPWAISYFVGEALQANMVISYRITDFFWLVFYTTAGIGLLADVPVLMVLLNTAGVSYRSMRDRWREVTVGILLFAAVFTPAGILTMFLVTLPLMVVYGIGLGVLFVLTFGGRRDLVTWFERLGSRTSEA